MIHRPLYGLCHFDHASIIKRKGDEETKDRAQNDKAEAHHKKDDNQIYYRMFCGAGT